MGSRRYETSRNISRLELIFHRNFLRAPFELKYLKEGIEFTRKRWAPFFRKIENFELSLPSASYLILPRNFLPFRIPARKAKLFLKRNEGWKPFPRDQNFFHSFFLLSSDWFPANLSPRFSRESRDEARLRSGIVGIKSRWGEKKDLLLQREIQNSFSHPPIYVETDPFKRVSEFEPKLINKKLLPSFFFSFSLPLRV